MKMSEIYMALEIEYKNAEVIYDVLLKDKEDMEEQMNKLKEKLDDVVFRFEKARNNKDSIAMAMESLSEMGDFKPTKEEEEKEKEMMKQEEVKQVAEASKAIKEEQSLTWKHRNSLLVKYGKDGTKLGTYKTRGQLARQLGVEPSTVGYYMKQDIQTQLAKRGFYLQYE